MLFKNVAEIKKFLPVTKSFDFEDIEPFIDSAEPDYIIPFLSQEQYDAVHTAYQNATELAPLSESMAKLLKAIRRPLANAAYFSYMPFGNVTLGKGGITVSSNENNKVASQWRIEGLEKSLRENFFTGIEQMLILCETSPDAAPWRASSVGAEFRDGYINTVKEFDNQFIIGSRRTFIMFKPIMRRIDTAHIISVIGKAQASLIKTQIKDGSVSEANENLLQFIRPCVAAFTLAKATTELSMKFTETGLQVLTTSPFQTMNVVNTPSDNALEKLRKEKTEEGLSFKQDLYDFINKNYSAYPLFESDSSVYKPSVSTNLNDQDIGIYGMF